MKAITNHNIQQRTYLSPSLSASSLYHTIELVAVSLIFFLLCSLVLPGGQLVAQSATPFSSGLAPQFNNQRFAPGTVVRFMEAERLVRLGQWEKAIQAYDAALMDRPDLLPALVGRAEILHLMGRSGEADRDWQQAYRISATATTLLRQRRAQAPVQFLAHYPHQLVNQDVLPLADRATNAGVPEGYYQRQRDQAIALERPAVQEIIKFKMLGQTAQAETLLAEYRHQQAADPALFHLLSANVRLLNAEHHAALNEYTLALNQGASDWPETWYNRGLTYLMLNNYANGCADLQTSADRGFAPAGELLQELCNF